MIDMATYKEVHRVELRPQMRPHGLFAAGGKVYFGGGQGSLAMFRLSPDGTVTAIEPKGFDHLRDTGP